jgi:hypothetical protein
MSVSARWGPRASLVGFSLATRYFYAGLCHRDLFTNSCADCACAAPVAPASATEANSPGSSHADKLTNDSSDIGTVRPVHGC